MLGRDQIAACLLLLVLPRFVSHGTTFLSEPVAGPFTRSQQDTCLWFSGRQPATAGPIRKHVNAFRNRRLSFCLAVSAGLSSCSSRSPTTGAAIHRLGCANSAAMSLLVRCLSRRARGQRLPATQRQQRCCFV